MNSTSHLSSPLMPPSTHYPSSFNTYDMEHWSTSCTNGSKATLLAQGEKRFQKPQGFKEIKEKMAPFEEFELDTVKRLRVAGDADSVEARLKPRYGYNFDRALISRSREYASPPLEHNQKSHVVEPKPSHIVDGSRFFAVMIGINMYGSYPLHGCVSDALLMEKYLKEHLGVPDHHIQLLLESDNIPDNAIKPSRDNIIQALRGLATNEEIKFGDNIIVYFAGHGSSYSDFDDANTYGIIETLCPIDRDSLDDNGRPIPDISDREFNTILSHIAEVKGHRITVILDCCHTGGSLRCLPEPGSRTPAKMPRATLKDTLLAGENHLKDYPSYCSILKRDWRPNMESHVLLAACRDYQFAKEKKVKGKDGVVTGYIGIFTDSLVRVLQSGQCTESTYIDLISAVGTSSHQTPVVAGKHKNSRVWWQEG